jgi:hypothetical protein
LTPPISAGRTTLGKEDGTSPTIRLTPQSGRDIERLSTTPPGDTKKLDVVKEEARTVERVKPSKPEQSTRPPIMQQASTTKEARKVDEAPKKQYTRPPVHQTPKQQPTPEFEPKIEPKHHISHAQPSPRPLPTIAIPNKSYYTVNEHSYQKIELIGKGGSSKVYKIISDAGKILALKRVKLKGLDTMTIDGLMNEVELLTKVADDDRIIKLWDWEKTDECLMMVLEYGEIDLANLIKKENSTNFIRMYWEQVRVYFNCVDAPSSTFYP